MNTDCFSTIGSTHFVSEDYAITNNRGKDKKIIGRPYAIISDGCSGSPRTDIGARLLATSLEGFYKSDGVPINEKSIKTCYKFSAENSKEIIETLSLPPNCLDATLLSLVANEDTFYFAMSGDGILVLKGKECLSIFQIEFSYNAPYYMSYDLDKNRGNVYRESNQTRMLYNYLINYKTEEIKSSGMPISEDILIESRPIEGYEWAAIFSDGAESFLTSKGDVVSWLSIIQELSSFKNFAGDFVKRRAKSFFKEHTGNWFKNHVDDISIAAIYFGD